MSRAVRTLMHVIIIAAAVVTPLIWMPLVQPSAQIWGFRFGLPIAAIVMFWLLLRKSESIADPTDHLRNLCGHYFERRGLCFHPRLVAMDGVCWLEVHFQGRYLAKCRARVELLPRPYNRRLLLEPMATDFKCDGGEFGVARVPVAIPSAALGKKVCCDVIAHVDYPRGKHRMIRRQEGILVGSETTQRSFTVGNSLAAELLSTTGYTNPSQTAITILTVPDGVAASIPDDAKTIVVTLAAPDSPTGGFPVGQVIA